MCKHDASKPIIPQSAAAAALQEAAAPARTLAQRLSRIGTGFRAMLAWRRGESLELPRLEPQGGPSGQSGRSRRARGSAARRSRSASAGQPLLLPGPDAEVDLEAAGGGPGRPLQPHGGQSTSSMAAIAQTAQQSYEPPSAEQVLAQQQQQQPEQQAGAGSSGAPPPSAEPIQIPATAPEPQGAQPQQDAVGRASVSSEISEAAELVPPTPPIHAPFGQEARAGGRAGSSNSRDAGSRTNQQQQPGSSQQR